jgi:glucose/arabinose dehydrogenase
MNSLLLLLLLLLLLPTILTQSASPPSTTLFYKALQDDFITSFIFKPDDNSILCTTKGKGQVLQISSNGLTRKVIHTVTNVASHGEAGLLGIAIDPRSPSTSYFYYATIYASHNNNNDGMNITNVVRHVNGINNGVETTLWSSNTPGWYHIGGRIKIHNNKLFVFIGDRHNAATSQSIVRDEGKILRMNLDGTIPSDNPWPGKYFYSIGHRNSFGFDFDPVTDQLVESENGPECNDEINIVLPGKNYGWGPKETCRKNSGNLHPPKNTNRDGLPSRILPIYFFPQPPALTGLVFKTGSKSNIFYVSSVNSPYNVWQFQLNPSRSGVNKTSTKIIYSHSDGIFSMERRLTDGQIFFSDPSGLWKFSP